MSEVFDEEVNPLGMSDEEFMEAEFPNFDGEAEQQEYELPDETFDEDEPQEEQEPVAESEDVGSDEEDSTDDSDEDEPEEETTPDRNYKAEVEKLLAPFKANGKQMQVDNVEDAIALMQQGVNYNFKMAGLKPHLKILKSLENNGLLDENKLNRLIDIEKGNPQAIKQLIKDSKLDLDDFDPEEETQYSPGDYRVSDNEVELDEVLERIEYTPSYERTADIISKQWDQASKGKLSAEPRLIEMLNTQVNLGVYDRIVTQVDKEKALGRLNGLSDFDAYTQIGERLLQAGALQDLMNPEPTPQNVDLTDRTSSKKEADRAKRKQALKPNKSGGGKGENTQNMDFNPLAMSDEEFEKIATSKYL